MGIMEVIPEIIATGVSMRAIDRLLNIIRPIFGAGWPVD